MPPNARDARNTRNTRDTRIFAIFCNCKTRFFENILLFLCEIPDLHPAVSRAPPHCTSASVFQTTSILFFLSLMKISLQLHTLFLNSCLRTFAKIENKNLTSNFFTFSRKHAKSRTTAENIAYRTNQLPVGAQVFAPTACNPTISKILLLLINFTERKRIKSRTRFSAKSTQNLKICTKTPHFLIA